MALGRFACRSIASAALGVIAALGCGPQPPQRVISFGDSAVPPVDSGAADASDASSDTGTPDAGTDAGAPSCIVGSAFDVLTSVDPPTSFQFDLAATAGSALVAARARPADLYPGGAIEAVRLASNGTASTPAPLSDQPAGAMRDPAIAGAVAGSFRVFWSDTRSGSTPFGLRARAVAADGTVAASILEVTSDASRADTNLAVDRVAAGTLAVYTQQTMGPPAIVGAVVDATGTSTAPTVLTTSPALAGRMVIAADSTSHFGIFRSDDGTLRATQIAPDGTSVTTPSAVSVSSTVTSSFDFATTPSTRAVVFEDSIGGVREEAHFRAIDSIGDPYAEVNLTPVDQGYSPSLAPLAGGFLVAYRARPQGAATTTLRLVTVSAFGTVLATTDVVAAPSDSGDVRLRSGSDGYIYLAWEEDAQVSVSGVPGTLAGTRLRALVVDCR